MFAFSVRSHQTRYVPGSRCRKCVNVRGPFSPKGSPVVSPSQALSDATPAERFHTTRVVDQQGSGSASPVAPARPVVESAGATDRTGEVGRNGIVCVDWQQVSVGKHRAGARCDVLVTDQLLQFWIGSELMKTVARNGSGEVRKKHAQGSRASG
jgi:hypothetical protein